MSDKGNEEIIEYCLVTLPENGGNIDAPTLKQTLLPTFGEAVILQGTSSVTVAYVFFAELADKATEIAYRESEFGEAFVIRSFLPERYIHPKGVNKFMTSLGKKKKKTERENGQTEERIEINLATLWVKTNASSADTEFGKTLNRFLDTVRNATRDHEKIKLIGEIPLLPALYALDHCWSVAKEIDYNETKLKLRAQSRTAISL